jgi:lysozyme
MISEELEVQIKEDLVKHEGCKTEVYLCSEGIPTAGIGHMLLGVDGLEVGDDVPMEAVLEWFDNDYKEAVTDCCALFLNFASLPDQVKRVLVNMAFNLGRHRLSKFKNMIKAVNEGNWVKAADEMVDSRWYNQVGNRSVELENWMRNA